MATKSKPKDFGATVQTLSSGSTKKNSGNIDNDYVPSQGPVATQLICGTELFADTIYSKPVTPPDASYKHCLIDSSVRNLRIQSYLPDKDAVESTFSDNSHGLANTELTQLEEQSDGTFDLAYYQHPIGERADGVKTEGLERIVIASSIKGVTKDAPEGPRLYSSLAGSNNVAIMNSEGDLTFTAQCLLYVEINSGHDDGLLIYGKATTVFRSSNKTMIPDTIGQYKWSRDHMSSMNINTGYASVRKLVNSGYNHNTGVFHENKSYQHIVFNENSGAHTLTMTPEGHISSTKLYYPSHANDAPVMHIDWNVNENRVDRCVFYKATTNDDKHGNKYLITQAYEGHKVHNTKDLHTRLPVKCTYTEFDKKHHDSAKNPPQSVAPVDATGYGAFEYNWSKVNSVHSLYSYEQSNGNVYHVKLVEVSNQPYPSVVVLEKVAEGHWWHRASYPLKMPQPVSGNGDISKIVSCFSKFGGMRYFLQDANNNLYLSRQQRFKNDNTPYGKPIYGPYDKNGDVETSFESEPLIIYTQKVGFDWHDIEGNCYQNSGSTSVDISPITVAKQLVLSTLMAFDTNTSSGDASYDGSAQAICLSTSGVVDVTTPRRTYHDSEYVSATIATDNGKSDSTTTVGIYCSINSLLERSWYHHEITSQIDYDPEAETQDSGDYYHLTLSPADDDGNVASLTKNDTNKHLLLEIRSDAPCSVTDMVSNYYHDINRYASFMAEVDPATNQANIVLKATKFGQNIYARLVDSRALQAASESDVSLIGSGSDGKIYPWQQINISEQAQYRMNNTVSSKQPTESSPASTKFMDTFVYVTGGTVANGTNPVSPSDDTKGPDYETKGKFKKSEDGMQPTANFINQSATNMLMVANNSSSCQMLYNSSDKFDPLYCMRKTSSTQTTMSNTTSFTYANGNVTNEPEGFTAPSSDTEGEDGSIFKKVSHDVGDALHHLQHLSDKAYSKLNKGVKISINVAASDAIFIDKSIMKAVNGIDEDLNEAIDTVEQYASIVVEVLKTIIKKSFMYEFIKLIMWLVSLFRYLSDIHDLANSLEGTLVEALQNPPVTIDVKSISDEIEKYIGAAGKSTIDSAFAESTNLSSKFGMKLPTNGLLMNVNQNPFTNKLINLVATKANKALNALDVIEFDYDSPTAADSLFKDLSSSGVSSDLNNCSDVILNDKVVEDLVLMVSEDIMHPQDIYEDFTTNISSIMGDIESNMVGNIVNVAEKIGNPIYDAKQETQKSDKYNLYFVEEIINSKAYLKLKLGVLGDLFKLCEIGSGSSSSLKVSGKDAIFFPMALALWVGLYIIKGKSYTKVPSQKQGTECDELGESIDYFDEADELISAVFGACSGALWGPCNPPGDKGGIDKEGCELLDSHCNVIMTLSQFICFWCDNYKTVGSAGNAFDGTFVNCQLITTTAGLVTNKKIKDKKTSEQVDMAIKWLYAFVSLVDLLGDVVLTSVGDVGPEDAILGVVGGDVMTNVGTFTDLVYNLVDEDNQKSMFEYAWPIIGFVPPIGYVMTAIDVA